MFSFKHFPIDQGDKQLSESFMRQRMEFKGSVSAAIFKIGNQQRPTV